MNQLSTSKAKAYNLLSIGQRSVGKTVFLAGSYAESNSDALTAALNKSSQRLWFDCQDTQSIKSIDGILNYVAQTGQYPPPTMKITDFKFSLKRHTQQGIETLTHFRWWDIPGEICNTSNPDFQKLVLISHGCCVFINADALVHDTGYLQVIENIIKQVVAIVSLAERYSLKYALALIFTKCDLLGNEALSILQIEEKAQPIVARLDAVKANYQRFYSAIPIVSDQGVASLKPKGTAAALLWLLSELKRIDNLQEQAELGLGLMQSHAELTEKASVGENSLNWNSDQRKTPQGISTNLNRPLALPNYLISMIIGILCFIGANVALYFVVVFGPLSPAANQAQAPQNSQVGQLKCPD